MFCVTITVLFCNFFNGDFPENVHYCVSVLKEISVRLNLFCVCIILYYESLRTYCTDLLYRCFIYTSL